MSKIYDVIILGAGPAGLAAGLYIRESPFIYIDCRKRERRRTELQSQMRLKTIGTDCRGRIRTFFNRRMTEQCEKFGVQRVTDVINDVVLEGDVKKLISAKGEYCGKTLIIATGAFARPIGCKGEKEFING